MANLINKPIPGPEQTYNFEQTVCVKAWYEPWFDTQLKPTVSAVPPVQGKGKVNA